MSAENIQARKDAEAVIALCADVPQPARFWDCLAALARERYSLQTNGESRQYDCELQLLATQDMALIVLGYDMQSFGIADIDEFREWQLTREAKQRELQIAQIRGEYEKLKKEFGE